MHCDDALCPVRLERVRSKMMALLKYDNEPTLEEEKKITEELKTINSKFDGYRRSYSNDTLSIAAICKHNESRANLERLKRQLVVWLPNGSWWQEIRIDEEKQICGLMNALQSKHNLCR